MIQKNEKQAIEAGDRMIKVRVATSNTRGFLVNLFEHSFSRVIFLYEKKDLYEVFGKTRGLLANVIKWRIFDYLGIFQVIKPVDSEENAYFSYNRFLDTDKPYLVLLENPSALRSSRKRDAAPEKFRELALAEKEMDRAIKEHD